MECFIVDNLTDNISEVDLFICCSSFEKRCFVIPDAISKVKPARSLVFYNKDFHSTIIENSQKLKNRLSNSESIDLSLRESSYTYTRIYETLKKNLKQPQITSVVIDITTFTHETMLILLKVISLMKRGDQKITFLYNGADDYSINETEPQKKWLTKGVIYTRSIIGYPGLTDLSLNDHLIIIFGFERDRTNRIIENFNYDNITLAFGFEQESVSKTHYDINRERHQDFIDQYSNIKGFELSLVDPLATKAQILSYVEDLDENIVILPMNTKLSTLGAGLAALENKNIQLYYSLAARYNTSGYSEPSNRIYSFRLE